VPISPTKFQSFEEGRFIRDRAADPIDPVVERPYTGELKLKVGDRTFESLQASFQDRFVYHDFLAKTVLTGSLI